MGKSHINILTISIEHFGIGIPVFWTVLDTGGSSSLEDRKKVACRVVEIIGLENIEVLLADREFIGEPWFRFLIEEKIPFIIRVKQNFLVKGIRSEYEVPIGELVKKTRQEKTDIKPFCLIMGDILFLFQLNMLNELKSL